MRQAIEAHTRDNAALRSEWGPDIQAHAEKRSGIEDGSTAEVRVKTDQNQAATPGFSPRRNVNGGPTQTFKSTTKKQKVMTCRLDRPSLKEKSVANRTREMP